MILSRATMEMKKEKEINFWTYKLLWFLEQHNVTQSDRFSNPLMELEEFKFWWLDYIMKIMITIIESQNMVQKLTAEK